MFYFVFTGSQKQLEKGQSRASSSLSIDKDFGSRNVKLTLEKSNVGSYYRNRKEAVDVRKGKVIYSNMFETFKFFIIHY